MSDTPSPPTTHAQLAQIREQLRTVLPAVQGDASLRRALLHAQSAVETRLGLPNEAPKSARTRLR
jgi:hypothetical protein